MIKVLITRESGFGERKVLTLKEFQEKFNNINGRVDLVEAIGGDRIEFVMAVDYDNMRFTFHRAWAPCGNATCYIMDKHNRCVVIDTTDAEL